MKFADLFEHDGERPLSFGELAKQWISSHPTCTRAQFIEWAAKSNINKIAAANLYVRLHPRYQDRVFEQEGGESIAQMLDRGKKKLNSFYCGFYCGFHGHEDKEDEDSNWKRGYRKGRSASGTKVEH